MDVMYALGTGSRLKNFELRFSLRSIEKNLNNIGQVWIVGERPDWLQNVNHIELKDQATRVPDYNIMAKITKACEEKEISDNFLFINDDHFIMNYFNTETFPYFYAKDKNLDTYVKRRGLDGYGRRANNTLKTLVNLGFPIKHFDIHTPIIYNKQEFLKHVTAAEWDKNKDGFIIKSLYANSLKIKGEPLQDNKINQPPKQGDLIFSTYPHIRSCVTRFLQYTFPIQSRFERTGI